MYTAERQRAQPYLNSIPGPLFEQWYLLHHRMIRVVTNRPMLAEQVRNFLYYADLLAEYTYENSAQLPTEIPVDLMWEAGERLHRPIALTCYLFETRPGEAFPPAPAEPKPDATEWEYITGVDGPLRGRWKSGSMRYREYKAYPGVNCRISSALDKTDLYSSIYIEDLSKCTSWFIMRFVFYMELGKMFGYDGFEIVHGAAIALGETGALIIGSPGSGKSTLVLSCLHLVGMSHLADDVLFIAREDAVVHAYAFPEDIGIREGSRAMLGEFDFMQSLPDDQRQKRFIDIQQHFRGQIVGACPVRAIFFLHEVNRCPTFTAKLLTPAQSVAWLMQEFISQQKAKEEEAAFMLSIFSDMASQSASYALCLTPDAHENALRVRELIEKHSI